MEQRAPIDAPSAPAGPAAPPAAPADDVVDDADVPLAVEAAGDDALAAAAQQHLRAGCPGQTVFVPAGLGLRLAALALDAVIVPFAALFVVPLVFAATWFLSDVFDVRSYEVREVLGPLTFLLGMMASVAVTLAFDAWLGASLGKRLVHIRIGSLPGGAPAGPRTLWKRWAIKAFPALAACVCCAAGMILIAHRAVRGAREHFELVGVLDPTLLTGLALAAAALLAHLAWAALHRGRTLHDDLAATDVFRLALNSTRRGFEPILLAPPPHDGRATDD